MLFLLLNQHVLAEGSSDCQGTIQDVEDDDDDDGWAIVTKRLCHTHTLPDWSIDSGDIDFSSNQFCIIAYKGLHTAVASNCGDERDMYQPGVRLDGSGSGTEFHLKSGDASLPVNISLDRVDGANRYPLARGQNQVLEKNDRKCVCSLNEYRLNLRINSNHIWNGNQVAFSGSQFRGDFTLNVWNNDKGKYKIPSQSITVLLNIIPAIQISGLADMTLANINGSATGHQDFCVFAIGADTFSLLPDSLNGQNRWGLYKDFRLKSGSTTMPYEIKVSDGPKTESIEGVWFGWPFAGWQPSRSLECRGSGNNMSIEVKVTDTSGPAGVYTDTMTLTVTPE